MEAESGQLLLDFDPGELSRLLEVRPRENARAEREQRQAAEHWFQRGLDLEATGAPPHRNRLQPTRRLSNSTRYPPERS